MRNNRFNRGSSTFRCHVCGRNTRFTGVQSVGSELCPECYELAGMENSVLDGVEVGEVRDAARGLVADVEAKGGNAAEWRATFGL